VDSTVVPFGRGRSRAIAVVLARRYVRSAGVVSERPVAPLVRVLATVARARSAHPGRVLVRQSDASSIQKIRCAALTSSLGGRIRVVLLVRPSTTILSPIRTPPETDRSPRSPFVPG
jgi:hypothetical protein